MNVFFIKKKKTPVSMNGLPANYMLSLSRVPYLAVARTFEKIEEDSGR